MSTVASCEITPNITGNSQRLQMHFYNQNWAQAGTSHATQREVGLSRAMPPNAKECVSIRVWAAALFFWAWSNRVSITSMLQGNWLRNARSTLESEKKKIGFNCKRADAGSNFHLSFTLYDEHQSRQTRCVYANGKLAAIKNN